MDLFNSTNDPINLDMKDADVVYYPNFFDQTQSLELFHKLLKNTPWRQDKITLFGKTHLQPRLTALYANNKKTYSYSTITMEPILFTKELLFIKQKIEYITLTNFTTCLLNLYRNGQDSNGWHADDEKELGNTPIIASVSLGQERSFHFKHKTDKTRKKKLVLQNGSLLLMKGTTQQYWLHQIPKTKTANQPRINLTYRVIN